MSKSCVLFESGSKAVGKGNQDILSCDSLPKNMEHKTHLGTLDSSWVSRIQDPKNPKSVLVALLHVEDGDSKIHKHC